MELTIKQALQKGIVAHKEGKTQDAERLYRAILQSQPTHPDANHNLGVLAISVNKIDTALQFFKTALEANPKTEQFWLSYVNALIKDKQYKKAKKILDEAKNKGLAEEKINILVERLRSTSELEEPKLIKQKKKNIRSKNTNPPQSQINNLLKLYQDGNLYKAEKLALSIIEEYPKYQFAYKLLGSLLGTSGRISEALNINQKSVELSPKDALAHYNLGITLNDLGRFEEAEASYMKAIALKPDLSQVYNNLGNTLKDLDRLDEAEEKYKKAISLELNSAKAHFNLGSIFYINGDTDAAIESLAKANEIDPKYIDAKILLSVIKARKARDKIKINKNIKSKPNLNIGLTSNPLYLNREVEPELIASLLEMQSRKMDEARNTPVFGNGRCSLDYNMFEINSPIIKIVENDLIKLMKTAVKTDIYLQDSFFNIYGAGAGIPPHQHLSKMDRDKYLNLEKQKYSLVYYLSVGDQDCNEPGILKLYDPDEEILPSKGMVLIFPASRKHSAVYGGKTDRVIIGINFYAL